LGKLELGKPELGMVSGDWVAGDCTGGSPKPSFRLVCPGVISPVEGAAENSDDCAGAAQGYASEKMSARARRYFGAVTMVAAFSAQIAAISSR
jgi:hypothetical protein